MENEKKPRAVLDDEHLLELTQTSKCAQVHRQREIYDRFLFFVPERGNDRSIVVCVRVFLLG